MQVKNPGGPVVIQALGITVDHNETVDVPTEVGVSLVEQGWVSQRSIAAKKAAKKAAADPAPATDAPASNEPAAADTKGN